MDLDDSQLCKIEGRLLCHSAPKIEKKYFLNLFFNFSPQALQQYQQQRLRTPNYSQNGGHSHMGNSNRGGRGGRTSAPRPRSSERPNYQQQQQQPPPPKPQTQPPKNNVNSVQLLEQHFAQNNLGELTFKTATMEMKSGGGNNPKNKVNFEFP